MADSDIGRRRAAGRVSGCRTVNQTKATTAMPKKDANMARHPASHWIPCPSAGAMVGARMNSEVAKDISRAIWRPSY